MTKDIMFNNSNVLYDLRYQAVFDENIQSSPKQLTYNAKPNTPISPYQSPTATPGPSVPAFLQTTAPQRASESASPYAPPNFPPPPKVPQVYDIELFKSFMENNPNIKFIYVQWLDYTATVRSRVVPIREFTRIINEGRRIGISRGTTGILQNDGPTPVMNTTGQIYVEPDLRSLCRTHNKDPLPAATVFSYWRSENGSALPEDPRNNLEILINDLQYNYSATLLIGFEIEVTFLRRNTPSPSTNASQAEPSPLTKTHAWSTMSPEQWIQLPFLGEIVLALEDMGIELQQFHAESAPGQYEFVLPPQPPLLAIDTLIQARHAIAQIASLHDLRATLHPQPFEGIGTAAHAHISLHPPDRDMQFFVGGILRHLPAICAFTMPQEDSYARVKDNSWSGGSWVCYPLHFPPFSDSKRERERERNTPSSNEYIQVAWGTQNRETPLRRVEPGHWEIRALDGTANIYFVLSALLAAGILGLSANEPASAYPERDISVNPAKLDDEDRAELGVTQMLPKSLGEAMDALHRDAALHEALAPGLVRDYLAIKDGERRMLGAMSEYERRMFLIDRY